MRKLTFILLFFITAIAGYAFGTPENVYLLGNIEGRNWEPGNGVAMTKNGDIFTQEVSLKKEEGKTVAYFRFTTVLSSDWDKDVNTNCYGPSVNNESLSLGESSSFVKTTNNWTLPDGTYKITIDFSKSTLTAEKTGGGSEIVTPPLSGSYTVYFENTKKWDQVGIWAWHSGKNFFDSEWPGEEMTETETVNGVEYYKYTIEYTGTHNDPKVMFNEFKNGGAKTGEFKLKDNWIYDYNGMVGEMVHPDTPPTITVSPDGGTVNYSSFITVGIDGTSPIDITASFNGQDLALSEGSNSFQVSKYLADGATGSLIIKASNAFGTVEYDKEFTCHDMPVEGLSGTLPVIYINVPEKVGGYAITDYNLPHKEYFTGSYWLDLNGCDWMAAEGATSIGSKDAPLPLEIKARGNYTRAGYAKKPFKLKLGAKQSMLGLTKSKHFALIAHADDDKGFLRNFTGFYLGRQINPSQFVDPAKTVWSPWQQPVEVVINGDYRGLYFLTESIRVDPERINIKELNDNAEDPALISGGYVVELDNYPDDNQITMTEGGTGNTLYITPDTPELYSSLQKEFVSEQFTAMNNAVGSVSDDLWKYMDLDDAVRYYMVMEIIGHWEAYHGSTYLHRDRGEGQKWHFGPLWDCGHAFGADPNKFITDNSCPIDGGIHYGNTWIGKIKQNAKFDEKLKATWLWFMTDKDEQGRTPYTHLIEDIDAYAGHVSEAAKADHERWNGIKPSVRLESPHGGYFDIDPDGVRDNSDMTSKKTSVVNYLDSRVNWLKTKWGDFTGSTYSEPERDATEAAPLPEYAKHHDSVYLYVKNSAGWGNVNAYIYNSGTDVYEAWPGTDMAYGRSIEYNGEAGLYYIEVPAKYSTGYIIFNDRGKIQIPGTGKSGFELTGKNCLFDNGSNSNTLQVLDSQLTPYSKTVPVLQISTNSEDDAAKLAAKQKALATLSLDPMGDASVSAFGMDENGPLTVEIKGRGTTSWDNFEKKPYKLTLDSKAALMGLPASKHFVLLPFAGDARNGLLSNPVGHKLAELIGMDWTPGMEGVEVVLDGKYLGFYFIVENIRPAGKRVQVNDIGDPGYDREEDWILEIDDTYTGGDAPYSWTENNGYDVTHYVVPSNPELKDWVADGIGTESEWTSIVSTHARNLNDAVTKACEGDGWDTTWKQTIDLDQAARYYIVQELMDDSDAFNTSFYMTHTAGSAWKFGPVWNFGTAFCQQGNKTMRAYAKNHQTWIESLYKNRYFRMAVIDILDDFTKTEVAPARSLSARAAEDVRSSAATGRFNEIFPFIDEYVEKYGEAVRKDALQWGDYAATSEDAPLADRADNVKNYLRDSSSYLLGEGRDDEGGTTGVGNVCVDDSDARPVYYDMMGRRIAEPSVGSLYIVRRGDVVTKEVVR